MATIPAPTRLTIESVAAYARNHGAYLWISPRSRKATRSRYTLYAGTNVVTEGALRYIGSGETLASIVRILRAGGF
jgi:hypothetical protein